MYDHFIGFLRLAQKRQRIFHYLEVDVSMMTLDELLEITPESSYSSDQKKLVDKAQLARREVHKVLARYLEFKPFPSGWTVQDAYDATRQKIYKEDYCPKQYADDDKMRASKIKSGAPPKWL